MNTCLIIDTGNIFHRASIEARDANDTDEMVGLTISRVLSMVGSAYQIFGAKHTVFAFESKSWRHSVFPDYKKARREKVRTPREEKMREALFHAMDQFKKFLEEKTNATCIQALGAEGDDIIAFWVRNNPHLEHIIFSNDKDLTQLVSSNVSIYQGFSAKVLTLEGALVNDENTPKPLPSSFKRWESRWRKLPETIDYEWILFEKIMRGDQSDGIPTAIKPRTRTTVLTEAYNNHGGETYNSLVDHIRKDLPEAPSVKKLIERNRELIDLTFCPESVIKNIEKSIEANMQRPRALRIGMSFLRFCGTMGMMRSGKNTDTLIPPYLSSTSDILKG